MIFYYDIFPQTETLLASHGLTLHWLATWRDVLAEARTAAHFAPGTLDEVERFLAEPLAWSAAHGGIETLSR